ncbi:exported hypothetical protein [Clostridioides difficile E9]|nr:exported hypothetical protein [Clostridioides difficile E9]
MPLWCRAGASVPSGSVSLSGVPAFSPYAAPAAALLRSFQSPDSVFPASHSWAASSLGSRI